MPFVVYEDRVRVYSGSFDRPAWDALARNRDRTSRFRFDCCDSKVVLRTSRLGLPFFAHAPNQVCDESRNNPESMPHQVLKVAIKDEMDRWPGWTA